MIISSVRDLSTDPPALLASFVMTLGSSPGNNEVRLVTWSYSNNDRDRALDDVGVGFIPSGFVLLGSGGGANVRGGGE